MELLREQYRATKNRKDREIITMRGKILGWAIEIEDTMDKEAKEFEEEVKEALT